MRVSKHLVDAVDWRRINLVDAPEVASVGEFDAIICRNVLIYFSDATVARVVGSLVQQLRPGGRLVVGSSESLLRFNLPVSCEEQGGAFFYRKAGI